MQGCNQSITGAVAFTGQFPDISGQPPSAGWQHAALAGGSNGQVQQLVVQQQPGQLGGVLATDPQPVAPQNFAYQPPHHEEMMRQLMLYSQLYGVDPRHAVGAAAGMLGAGMEAAMFHGPWGNPPSAPRSDGVQPPAQLAPAHIGTGPALFNNTTGNPGAQMPGAPAFQHAAAAAAAAMAAAVTSGATPAAAAAAAATAAATAASAEPPAAAMSSMQAPLAGMPQQAGWPASYMGGMGGGPGFSGMLPGLDGSMAFHMPMGIDPASAPGLLHRTETAAASSSMQDTVMPLSMGFPLANMGYPAMPSNTLGMEALQTMSQVRQQHGDGSPNHMNRLPTGGTTSSLQNGSHQPVTGGILTPTAGNNRPRASHSSSHPHQSVSWGTYAAGQLDGVDRAGSSGDDDDEGDLDAEDKKLRRKQSNRESARRSRLRKQAEIAEVEATVTDMSTRTEQMQQKLAELQQSAHLMESSNSVLRELLACVHAKGGVASGQVSQSDLQPYYTRLLDIQTKLAACGGLGGHHIQSAPSSAKATKVPRRSAAVTTTAAKEADAAVAAAAAALTDGALQQMAQTSFAGLSQGMAGWPLSAAGEAEAARLMASLKESLGISLSDAAGRGAGMPKSMDMQAQDGLRSMTLPEAAATTANVKAEAEADGVVSWAPGQHAAQGCGAHAIDVHNMSKESVPPQTAAARDGAQQRQLSQQPVPLYMGMLPVGPPPPTAGAADKVGWQKAAAAAEAIAAAAVQRRVRSQQHLQQPSSDTGPHLGAGGSMQGLSRTQPHLLAPQTATHKHAPQGQQHQHQQLPASSTMPSPAARSAGRAGWEYSMDVKGMGSTGADEMQRLQRGSPVVDHMLQVEHMLQMARGQGGVVPEGLQGGAAGMEQLLNRQLAPSTHGSLPRQSSRRGSGLTAGAPGEGSGDHMDTLGPAHAQLRGTKHMRSGSCSDPDAAGKPEGAGGGLIPYGQLEGCEDRSEHTSEAAEGSSEGDGQSESRGLSPAQYPRHRPTVGSGGGKAEEQSRGGSPGQLVSHGMRMHLASSLPSLMISASEQGGDPAAQLLHSTRPLSRAVSAAVPSSMLQRSRSGSDDRNPSSEERDMLTGSLGPGEGGAVGGAHAGAGSGSDIDWGPLPSMQHDNSSNKLGGSSSDPMLLPASGGEMSLGNTQDLGDGALLGSGIR